MSVEFDEGELLMITLLRFLNSGKLLRIIKGEAIEPGERGRARPSVWSWGPLNLEKLS